MPHAPERYLEDDGHLHKKLITSCEILYDVQVDEEDSEETKEILLHERMLNPLSFA